MDGKRQLMDGSSPVCSRKKKGSCGWQKVAMLSVVGCAVCAVMDSK